MHRNSETKACRSASPLPVSSMLFICLLERGATSLQPRSVSLLPTSRVRVGEFRHHLRAAHNKSAESEVKVYFVYSDRNTRGMSRVRNAMRNEKCWEIFKSFYSAGYNFVSGQKELILYRIARILQFYNSVAIWRLGRNYSRQTPFERMNRSDEPMWKSLFGFRLYFSNDNSSVGKNGRSRNFNYILIVVNFLPE